MKIFCQTLTLIISFQLAVGCNSAAVSGDAITRPKTPTPSTGDSLEISGSIARVINTFSGLMMSSAHAVEGNLYIYDVTNPLAPSEMHAETISGKYNFKVKMKKSEVGSKLLKAVFVSSEGHEKSRELLFDLEGSESIVDASMDENTSMRSKIFEAQLIAENVSDFKSRFKEIKSDSLSNEFAMLGDSTLLSKLMLDPSLSVSIAELIARRRIAVSKGDVDGSFELQRKLFSIAVDNGVVTDQSVLNCGSNSGTFFFTDRKFRVFAKPIDVEIFKKYNGLIELGIVSTPDEAAKKITELVSILSEFSKSIEKNMSARIFFEELDLDLKPILSCRLFGQEVSESELMEINNLLEKDNVNSYFFNSLSYVDVGSIDEALQKLFDLYVKTNLDFKESTASLWPDPLIVSEASKRTNFLFEKRFIEFFKYFNETKSSYPYELDTSFFQAVDFESVGTSDKGYKHLLEAHDKTLSSLKEFLSTQKIEPYEVEIIMNEQSYLCKYLLEVKLMEMKWYFSNNK
jgi:hypothetical protein